MTLPSSELRTIPRQFRISPLGKRIGKHGPEAQLLAMYLLSSPLLDTSGYYALPLSAAEAHTRIDAERLKVLLSQLKEIGFCTYDWETEQVHVPLVTDIYATLFNPTLINTQEHTS